MEFLIPIGAALTLIGIGGFIWMIRKAAGLRKETEADRAQLQRLVAVNMGVLALSAIGLMLVVVGMLM